MSRLRLSAAIKALVADLYSKVQRTVDDLPYTDEFEALYEQFIVRSGMSMTRHDFWKALAGCRKQSRLIRKRRNG